MANSDFRQVLIDYLSAPTVIISDKPADASIRGAHAITSRGGMGALPETIQFGKQRRIPGRMAQFVTFEDAQGSQPYTCFMLFSYGAHLFTRTLETKFLNCGTQPVRGRTIIDLFAGFNQERSRLGTRWQLVCFA